MSIVGIIASILVFLVLIIKFFVNKLDRDSKNYTLWVNYFMLAVSLIVMAVPDGLPLAVAISLVYSMKMMMSDHCLVRKMESCETMGSVTNICTDKTGTLTLNQMRVVKAMFGKTELGNDKFKNETTDFQRKKFNLVSTLCSTARLRANEKKSGEY